MKKILFYALASLLIASCGLEENNEESELEHTDPNTLPTSRVFKKSHSISKAIYVTENGKIFFNKSGFASSSFDADLGSVETKISYKLNMHDALGKVLKAISLTNTAEKLAYHSKTDKLYVFGRGVKGCELLVHHLKANRTEVIKNYPVRNDLNIEQCGEAQFVSNEDFIVLGFLNDTDSVDVIDLRDGKISTKMLRGEASRNQLDSRTISSLDKSAGRISIIGRGVDTHKAVFYDLSNETVFPSSKVLPSLPARLAGSKVGYNLVLSVDGKRYYYFEKNLILVFNVETGAKVKEFKGIHPLSGTGLFTSFSVRPDEKYVIGLLDNGLDSYSGPSKPAEVQVVLFEGVSQKVLKNDGISNLTEPSNSMSIHFGLDKLFYIKSGMVSTELEFFEI